jgi:hypothetical protein
MLARNIAGVLIKMRCVSVRTVGKVAEAVDCDRTLPSAFNIFCDNCLRYSNLSF